MNQITLLSKDTIDKIAAGEVVERPASVVKELVENAIDAGANAVTVEIREGGISLVRITDNGSGIPGEQVRTAFLRHATSKIRTVEDLLTAGTLGFRGEALSSIAAVCQVEMITKTAGGITGVRYVIEGGEEKSLEEIGAPEGTTFLVRNLFYNTPARRKFLRTATTEAGYVSDLMERMALSHPGVSFKFISNGDVKLHTSGNCSLRDIVYGIYGREITGNLVKIDAEAGKGFHIGGFIGKPAVSRGNRNYENYFVNGRYVKSAIVARAIEDAYKPFLMNHRFPFTVLMLELDGTQVDVNVHPTKMEVRFADQSGVYESVCRAVKDGLLGRELIPEITIGAPTGGKSDDHGAGPDIRDLLPAGKGMPKRGEGPVQGKPSQDTGTAGRNPDASRTEPAGKEAAVGNAVFAGGPAGKESSAGSAASAGGPAGKGPAAENAASAGGQPGQDGRRRFVYPEPFEKMRSRLIAEADSPYEPKYPQWARTGTIRPVTGNVADGAVVGGTADGTSAENAVPGSGPADGADTNGRTADSTAPGGGPAGGADTNGRTADSPAPGGGPADSTAGGTDIARSADGTAPGAAPSDSAAPGGVKPVQMELFDGKFLSEEGLRRHRLIGQIFETYWLAEFEDKLYIIDQHAAHEKVLYERFMERFRKKEQTSQMVAPPLIVTLSLQEEAALKQNMEHFAAIGFVIEPFGGREYAVSAVPGDLYGLTDRAVFTEILDGLTDAAGRASGQAVIEKIASMSCKAAVKGNHRMTAQEADALIAELLTLENPYNCPHGRPTIVSMTKQELEKKFKRIV